ncbi:hypothetical protein B0H17DRAFT_1146591 [Mycena rosella]|uniref:Uncharacterized protein n=1 Tax=Mycena rosella TaxID=1033263 RepID=A0AAD7G0N3_MYCRO|nr:hypothetical protein B0H17DRAFT_1146591 [Mycena rosella]
MAKANLVRRSDRWQDTKLVAPSWNVQHLNLGFLKFLNVWTQTRTPKRSNTFAGTRVTVNVFLPPIIKTSKARRRSLSNELLKGLFPETEHDLYSPGPSLKRRVPSQSCVWCRQTGPNPSPMCLSSAGAENVFSFTPSPLDAFNVDGALQMILIESTSTEVHLLNLPAALAASRARFLYTTLLYLQLQYPFCISLQSTNNTVVLLATEMKISKNTYLADTFLHAEASLQRHVSGESRPADDHVIDRWRCKTRVCFIHVRNFGIMNNKTYYKDSPAQIVEILYRLAPPRVLAVQFSRYKPHTPSYRPHSPKVKSVVDAAEATGKAYLGCSAVVHIWDF